MPKLITKKYLPVPTFAIKSSQKPLPSLSSSSIRVDSSIKKKMFRKVTFQLNYGGKNSFIYRKKKRQNNHPMRAPILYATSKRPYFRTHQIDNKGKRMSL